MLVAEAEKPISPTTDSLFEMFSGMPSESTTPFTMFSHSGISSSQLSTMKTRRMYSLMLLHFFFTGRPLRAMAAVVPRDRRLGLGRPPAARTLFNINGFYSK